MPGADTTTDADGTGRTGDPAVAEAIRSTEAYEVSDGVVFYDAENPLAWLQADHAVSLDAVA